MNNTSSLVETTLTDSSTLPVARRVLLVEDEESHARIIQRSFERHGGTFELTVASTLSEGTLALGGPAFDLVISDWRLPDGEGFDLLKDKPRCPLLIMTSHGNEQIAVEAMRAGALDYIVKSESSLLAMPNIAERAIRLWTSMAARDLAQEELRIAEETLRERRKEEEWFRLVVEAAPYAIVVTRIDGLIIVVNSQTEKLFGYRREELLGQSVEMLLPEPLGAPAGWKMKAGRELFGLHKDGSEIPIEISLDPIGTSGGQFLLVSIADITERRKAEEHLQLFQTLVEGVQDYAIFMLDPEGYVISWNEGASRVKGYSDHEIVGQHFR